MELDRTLGPVRLHRPPQPLPRKQPTATARTQCPTLLCVVPVLRWGWRLTSAQSGTHKAMGPAGILTIFRPGTGWIASIQN